MKSEAGKPPEIEAFCNTCSRGLADLKDNRSRIAYASRILPPFLAQKNVFKRILQNIIEEVPYPDIGKPTMFINELILHLDPAGHFSLRMFLWRPGEYDPVHDHNSWGVIGPVSGRLEVIDYKRLDRGSSGRQARIVENARRMIAPGEFYSVHPLNRGIHQTGNPTDRTTIQVSIYGKKQTKRNFINTYEPETGSIARLYPPKMQKRAFAEAAFAELEKNSILFS